MSTKTDPILLSLSVLLQLEQAARHAESQRELAFLFVNDSRQLLSYHQAFFWRFDDFGRRKIELASNVSEIDPHSKTALALLDLLGWVSGQDAASGIHPFTSADLPSELRSFWESEGFSPYLLAVPMKTAHGVDMGGLLFASAEPWNQAHMTLVEKLADAYVHAWVALEGPRRKKQVLSHFRNNWRRYAAGAAFLLLFPFRQYVLVPAEVVAKEPFIVSAPVSGVVHAVTVRPNVEVKKGDLLFELDGTDFLNRLNVAKKAFDVVEAEYLKNSQQAFNCESCRAKLPELAASMEKQRAEVAWVSAQFEQSRVLSPVKGVAIFSDQNDWRGRPVSVGERVMMVADPSDTRLQISMPVSDAIAIENDTDVVFYSNVNPLDSYSAKISSTSYEAFPTPEQVLAYRLYASFEGKEHPRLGMRGTAKVYGARAPLIYYLLRRPAVWLRRTLGI
ncbi:MAG: biotin/lipoyl-binding protein [Pedobacter sp.]|nr:biotin/lipoyl-binding protein [Pedobacter sp.]